MNITDIRIRKTYTENRLRALVSITIDYDLAVHDIKVIEGPERLFVAMPSRKDENGSFRDIAHPITPQARKQLEDVVLGAYEQYLAQQPASPRSRLRKPLADRPPDRAVGTKPLQRAGHHLSGLNFSHIKAAPPGWRPGRAVCVFCLSLLRNYFLFLVRATPPTRDSTARLAIRPTRSSAPVSGFTLSEPPLR